MVELDDSIQMASISENADTLGSYRRRSMAPPAEKNSKVMRIQAELMVSMAKNHEEFFGDLGYVMIRSKHLDVFLFPLGSRGHKIRILAVTVKPPYDHDAIAEKILAQIDGRSKD